MSNFNSRIEIDSAELVDAICDTSDFKSAVRNVIDDIDFSWQFGDIIDDYDFDDKIDYRLDRYDLITDDNFQSEFNDAVTNSKELTALIDARIQAATVTVTADSTPTELLQILATFHKVCGNLAQQIAVINAVTGTHPWPTEVATPLARISSILNTLGYDVAANEQ